MTPRIYRDMAVLNAVTVIASAWVAVAHSSWLWALIAVCWFVVMLFNLANYRRVR